MAEHIHHHIDHEAGDDTGASAFMVLIVLIAMFAVGALLYFYTINQRALPGFTPTGSDVNIDVNGGAEVPVTPDTNGQN